MIIAEQGNFKIHFNSFKCYKTYGGLIAGLPNDRINNILIENMYESVERALGVCKIHLIEPKVVIRKNMPYLPRYINAVRLHSGAMHKNADGSILIIVWFSDTVPSDLLQVSTNVANTINWVELADDFNF